MLVFCQYTIVYSAITISNKRGLHCCIGYVCRCILRSENIYVSETLARFARSRNFEIHVRDFFFPRYIWGGLAPPPPPQYQKAGYATDVNTWGCGPLLTPTGVKFNTPGPVFAVWVCVFLYVCLFCFCRYNWTHKRSFFIDIVKYDTPTHFERDIIFVSLLFAMVKSSFVYIIGSFVFPSITEYPPPPIPKCLYTYAMYCQTLAKV